MIDRTHQLPVVRPCQLLALARATAYYQATPVSATELALMRRIDELSIHNQTRPHRALDGHTPKGVYVDNLPARLTAA